MGIKEMTSEISREVAHELNGATKKWKVAEVIRWIITVAFLAGMYLSGFVTRESADAAYVHKDVYNEHVKAQEAQYNELLRRTQENQVLLRDIERFLRKQSTK